MSMLLHFGALLFHSIGLLSLLVTSAFGAGALVVHGVGLRDRSQPEFYLFSVAIGLGVLAHLTLALGVLGLLYTATAWTLLAVGTLLGMLEAFRYRAVYQHMRTQARLPTTIPLFSVVLIFILGLNLLYPLLFVTLLPPLNWDEVAYHLAIPKIYIDHHAVTYIDFIPYANWPLESEMLFTLSLLLASEPLAHLVSWVALLLICGGLYQFGRRYLNGQVGLLAAVIFSSTPTAWSLSSVALVEMLLALYTFLAMFAFFNWLKHGDRSNWMLSAVCGGLAASTKLNGALTPLFLGVLLLAVMLLRQPSQPAKGIVTFMQYGLLAGMVVAPWYLKTWIHTGNPFWPFFLEILGGRDWDALGSEYLFGFIRLPNMSLTPANWLSGLWLLAFRGEQFGPQYVALEWRYLVLLLALGPLSLLFRPLYHWTLRWLCVLGLLWYTVWFFQTHQTRFLLPTLPILVLLMAAGVAWLWSLRQGWWRVFIQAGLLLGIVQLLWVTYSANVAAMPVRWLFLSGQITRQEFLQAVIPGYDTYVYANEHLPPDAYVLMALYESRGYYLDRRYAWANPISQRILRLEQFSDAQQLATELQARGFTHIIFNSAKLDTYLYIRYGQTITPLVRTFIAEHTRLIYHSSELGLYELLPE